MSDALLQRADPDILSDLHRRGVRVTLGANGHDLRLNPRADSRALPPALFLEVVERQDELRAALVCVKDEAVTPPGLRRPDNRPQNQVKTG